MKANVRSLHYTEAARLVNSTPLGTVISSSVLRRHAEQAGYTLGDGKRIDLLRYVAWLVGQVEAAGAAAAERADRYVEARRRQAERNRAATKAGQDIFPVPDVANPARRLAAVASLRNFYETYFPAVFYWPWSDDHLRVIAKIERAVKEGGLFAYAMPRGSGKTVLAWTAALWAILGGYQDFVCLVGGSESKAKELLTSIRLTVLENELLAQDFPEAIYPLRCLENSSKRQLQQHIRGRLTHVHWADDKLVFPTIWPEHLPAGWRDWPEMARNGPKRPAQGEQKPHCGAIITVTSLDANIRGPHHARPDGSVVRPGLVLLDDPQTRQSARSPVLTRYRVDLLNGDVLGMAGPGREIAALLTCTKIYDGDMADQVLDHQRCPQWQAECTRLLDTPPSNEKAWNEYAELWREGMRKRGSWGAATRLYRDHRARCGEDLASARDCGRCAHRDDCMDADARLSWSARYDRRKELSALQHAMNLRLKHGEEAFAAEYQNAPVVQMTATPAMLRPPEVAEKLNGRPRAEAPLEAMALTAFIDIGDLVLYWCVAAWRQDFTGYIVDYGTWPDQQRRWFTARQPPRTLRAVHPGAGADGAIQAGLQTVAGELLVREFPKAGGGVMRIDRLLVDAGYKPELAAAVKHRLGTSTLWLAKGVGIRAGNRPISSYERKPGWRLGHHWYVPSVVRTREFAHVCVDVNYWKTQVHRSFAAAAGDPESLTLWGRKSQEHELFADHIAASETFTETFGHGRIVQEWRERPAKPDNHWFDCLVGCAAAASMLGVAAAATKAAEAPAGRALTSADLRRRR